MARNYKAEEQRRNAIARALGFKNRAAMRKAIETGKIAPRRPKSVRSPRTIAAQKFRETVERRGLTPSSEYDVHVSKFSRPDRNQDWSDTHAKTDLASYGTSNIDETYKGASKAKKDYIARNGRAAYDKAYYAAFVDSVTGYRAKRHGGSYELYYWFVIVLHYWSMADYEDKYGSLD